MKVHELLSDPKRWTRRTMAQDIDGNGVEIDSPNAVRFCLVGALRKCYPLYGDYTIAHLKLQKAIGSEFLTSFNDCNTHKKVYYTVKKLDI